VSKLSRRGGGRNAPVRSLFPLIALSLLVAVLLTQSSVTLAYPSFQSPVEPPTVTPVVPPAETPAVPPAETPAAPPAETPAIPPGETPAPPPGGEETPPGGAEVTPTDGEPPEVPTATAEGEDDASLVRGMSPAVLIDTCVVGLSSVWMCCGGFALVVFLLLVLASFLLRVS
jgi:hypothetical protein